MNSSVLGKKATRAGSMKVSIASMIGTAVESYDNFIYGTAAAAFFGQAFFHTADPIVGVLAAFATLAAGFLTRPLGGYLAGHSLHPQIEEFQTSISARLLPCGWSYGRSVHGLRRYCSRSAGRRAVHAVGHARAA